MIPIALAATILALLVPTSAAGAGPPAGCDHAHRPADVWPIARTAWQRPDGPRSTERDRYRHRRVCSTRPARARRKWQNAKRRFEPVRQAKLERRAERRRYADIDPPGRAYLDRLGACESGGDYTTDTGNGYFGRYQFAPSTWRSVGGTGNPAHASPAEQDYRAALLWRTGGPGHWPVCG